jgi:hypothetical protein
MESTAKTTHKRTNHCLFSVPMFLCSCAFVFLCASVGVWAADLPRTAQLLPPETILLVDIPDFTQLTEQFKKTNLYKLYKDPAMAAFIEDAKEKIRAKIKESDDKFIATVLSADVLPAGRVAVALMPEQAEDVNEPRILVMAQWGQALPKVRETIDKVLAQAAEAGARTKTEDYRGVTITTLMSESDPALGYCFIDDCLVGSANLDLLKSVIARIKGAAAALADDRDYTAAAKAVGPHHDIDLYVSLKRAIAAMSAEEPTGQLKAAVTNLGLDNVISLGLSVGVGREAGSGSSGRAFLKIDGQKQGVCKMLEFESTALRVPKFAPAGFASASFVNLNFNKAYEELARVLQRFSPQAAALMYMPILPPSPDGRPGLTLKADIIDHLGSQVLGFQSIDKSSPAEPKAETLVALAVTNRSALESSLSKVHAMISQNNPDARRQLLGHTIYLIDLSAFLPAFMPAAQPSIQAPSEPPAPAIPPLPKVAFAVTDTHLVIGVESAVERAIRTLSTGSSGDLPKWFAKARSAVPDSVGLAGFEDTAAVAEVFWKEIKTAAAEEAESSDGSKHTVNIGVSTSGLAFSQAGLDIIDVKLLPEFDLVRKYFGLSATYGIARPDGFFFEFKYLNPD